MQQQPQSNQNTSLNGTISADDEIDLFELWAGLVEEKWTIFLSVVIILVIAATYAFTAQKIYQSEAEVILPNNSQIASLKTLSNAQNIDRESVYAQFLKNLQNQNTFQVLAHSEALSQLLADEGYDYDTALDLQAFLSDDHTFNVAWPEQNKKSEMSALHKTKLSMSLPSAQASQKALALVLEVANRQAVDELKQNLTLSLNKELETNPVHYQQENYKINLEIESEIERIQQADALKGQQLEQKIKALIENSKENLGDQLLRLNENLRIAQKLGITEPIEPGQYGTMQAKTTSNMTVDVNTQSGMKGYWMGTKILSAEINRLKQRQNLAAFIPEISDLKAQLLLLKQNPRVDQLKNRQSNLPYSERLRQLKVEKEKKLHDLSTLKTITFDTFLALKSPSTPKAPVKPKKSLIIAVAGVLGLMLGVFIALIRRAIKNRQVKEIDGDRLD